MDATRREMLTASLGLGLGAAAVSLLPGCKIEQTTRKAYIPPPTFGPEKRGPVPVAPSVADVRPLPPTPTPPVHQDPEPVTNTASVTIAGLNIRPRSAWTRTLGPISDNHHMMDGIKHITVHHEGWRVVDFEGEADTIERLEKIRGGHTRSKRDGGRGWADIGYHFIIDRAGRIWEGRNLKLQGAHVENCNENNLGIMCLGNFDDQFPSQKQLDTLARALKAFKAEYRIPMGEIFTHQEWKRRCPTTNTVCPGRNLQAKMAGIRRADVIG